MTQPTPTSDLEKDGADDDRAAELLRAHLDQELDEKGEELFDALAKDRPELLGEARALAAMLSAVKSLGDEPAPSGFYERVDRRLRQRQILEGDWFSSSLFSFSFQIVSVLILLGIAVAAVLMQIDDERPIKLERDASQEVQDTDGKGEDIVPGSSTKAGTESSPSP